MFRIIFICLLIGNSYATAIAQETWSLEKCINYAKQNNISLKRAKIVIVQSKLDEKKYKKSRLPYIGSRAGLGFQYGRNIDPTTNDFINTRLGYNNVSLNANLTIYSGGSVLNSIRQSQYNQIAAKEDALAAFQSVTLQIVSIYLDILLMQEQVIIAQTALEQSKEQLAQTDKKIQANIIPKVDRLELLAQIARDEQTLITNQNSLNLNYLKLKNLLEINPNKTIQVRIPEKKQLESQFNPLSLNSTYSQTLNTQATIKACEARIQSAAIGIKLAKTDALPKVSLFAGIDTRFSNVSNRDNESYFRQINQNFGQSFGLQITIPIYNNHRTIINLEQAELNVIDVEMQKKQAQQLLKAEVQETIANTEAAYLELEASKKSLVAAQLTYQNVLRKYQLGTMNSLELTTAKTNFDTAKLNLARAKYTYLFRLKIIDFYLGKELKLD